MNQNGDDPTAEHEEDDGQFAIEAGEGGRTLGTLIPRGTPVEVTVSLDRAEVPGKGLFSLDEDVVLVVRCRPRKYEPVPLREEGESTTRVKIRQTLKPLAVARADTAQGREMLGDLEFVG